MTIVLCLYFLIFFLFLLVLLYIFLFPINKEKTSASISIYPFVSILIAARNEEENIISCLEKMDILSYPKDKLEILIGDDHSEDKTYELVESFIHNKNQFRLIRIDKTVGKARGKANVLAQLAREAKGDFFLLTDADIEVPKDWVQGLLKFQEEGIGTVSGVTVIKGDSLFAKFQAMEWAIAFGMIQTVSDLGIPVTANGNNMMISKEAYFSTGGYEEIPFSVTEDFELFKHTLKNGYGFKNLLNPQVLAFSKPIKDFGMLLKQRKRWMRGAWQLPLILVIALTIQSLFFPMIIITLCLFPTWGICIWVIKIILQQIYASLVFRKIKLEMEFLTYALLFDIYSGVFSFILMIYYFLPIPVQWKGRNY